MTETLQHYSSRVGDALNLALQLHRDQPRKGTSIPYVSHLVAVAAFVMEDGGDEDEVIAALLHDAVEDQGGMPTAVMIREQFGERVGGIVLEVSDATTEDRSAKAPWEERKREYVAALPHKSDSALTVTAADKLHNTRATLFDLRSVAGTTVWNRFKAGKRGFLWYHEEVLTVLEQRLPTSLSVQRFAADLAELKALSQD